jgi:hypothetical protein
VFLLATDEGFKQESRIVWEKLNEVSGDTVYCNSDFEEVQLGETAEQASLEEIRRIQEADLKIRQEEEDLQLARKMQSEMNLAPRPISRPAPRPEAAVRSPQAADRVASSPAPQPVREPQQKQRKKKGVCLLS